MRDPFFNDKQVLVIDKDKKNNNDRTWCFWETKPGIFEDIVYHKWKQIDFYSNYFSGRFDIDPYEYKMIRGVDFYNYVLNKAQRQNNIHFLHGNVQSLSSVVNKCTVTVDEKQLTAGYVFNSIIFKNQFVTSAMLKTGQYYLLQHFKGWLIETPENIFDDRIATFMDFRISQQHGTSFIYVLPVAANKALIEYTLFTKELLQENEYNEALKNYLRSTLGLKQYKVTATEFGVIPMTNISFSQVNERIINIGTAGNQTKPSSGFTFQFIQKHSDAVINALIKGKNPNIVDRYLLKRFNIYDNTLLNILYNNKLGGDKIFADLFSKNPVQRVFRFLDNETNLVEELKLFGTVPTVVFLPAAVRELLR